ncbi:hypothetical protein Q5752_004068 [Cryptotrichosporon argae]
MSETKGDHLVKLLSVDPAKWVNVSNRDVVNSEPGCLSYPDAPCEGVRRVLEWFTGQSISRDLPIDTSRIEYLRMGTTVAINALLERKGERCALLITKGFKDALEIGTQTRPFLFQLAIKKACHRWRLGCSEADFQPDLLYTKVVEIEERVTPKWIEFVDKPELAPDGLGELVDGVNGSKMRIVEPMSMPMLRHESDPAAAHDLQALYTEGYRSIAVVLAHSTLAEQVGFPHISVSSDLQAMINMVSRGTSATANAYLTPEVRRYLDGFASGFKGGLQGDVTSGDACRVSFMQSDGSLCDFRKFSGLKAILSGPAGGVVGYACTGYDAAEGSPVVGFDMGGTSTDVSRYGGKYEHVFETTTAGVTIQTPQLDINTVATGGGSILSYRNGMFVCGPESAAAHPGPACYRKGGSLTVTDANLFLGRLHIDSFPNIFGPTEDMPLDYDVVQDKFEALTATINAENGSSLATAEIASNTAMARPIRALTEQRGFRTSAHNLSCFGGAGGQHANALAAILVMHNVLIHKYSSLLSAYGMALAVDNTKPFSMPYSADANAAVSERFEVLKKKGLDQLVAQGVPAALVVYECYLNLRYQGSDTRLMILQPPDSDFAKAFVDQHCREFAFVLESRVNVENVRVRAIGKGESDKSHLESSYYADLQSLPKIKLAEASHFATNDIYFEEVGKFTILLHPQNTARILRHHVHVDVGLGPRKTLDTATVDPIQLSIFSHRFMGIAEPMGRALQKTSISVQMKERLDFSCAIFGPDSSLVANAPNVPVNLGSMEYAVRVQAEMHNGKLRPGDILVSNHPKVGGTHLPDVTVIQPVFAEGSNDEIVFFVAARGHHGDIGGSEGNSMHPRSTESWQEGAVFLSPFLVRDGVFYETGVREIFAKAGEYPDCMATRQININLSDLKAQYGKEVVQHYMAAIRTNAELGVRSFLKSRAGEVLESEDYLDDGTIIHLKVMIDAEDGSATFAFTGTSPESLSNLNAPESVTRSGLIYSLRTLIGTDMPLNAGVLAPITLVIPPDTILSPSVNAAVSAGNTETSQRVVDVVLKAFEACAASQGCMNVCGGAGAGLTWVRQSAVHSNMTNTRIGDVEVAENRFPLLLREFSIRRGSGGKGQKAGGDGVHRECEARVDIHSAHVGERRVNKPYGMNGGGPGQRGATYWMRHAPGGGYRRVKMQPSSACSMKAGERLIIHTPGAGAYGSLDEGASPV